MIWLVVTMYLLLLSARKRASMGKEVQKETNHWPFNRGSFLLFQFQIKRALTSYKTFATTYWLLAGHRVGEAWVIFIPLWRSAVFLSSGIEWSSPQEAASQVSEKSQELKEQEYMNVMQQRSRKLCSNPSCSSGFSVLGWLTSVDCLSSLHQSSQSGPRTSQWGEQVYPHTISILKF